jgi:SAM-dependent methyltransferase
MQGNQLPRLSVAVALWRRYSFAIDRQQTSRVRGRRLTFGRAADLYDRARPSYPPVLIDDVLAFAGAGRALEVGAGTGKATVMFAARGVEVVAVEPSAEMAAVLRRNCEGYPGVSVVVSDFESWAGDRGGFRLLYSAQAWHWVAPEVRYRRAWELLDDGGALAVFFTGPRWQQTDLYEPFLAAYRAAVPRFEATGPMHPASEVERLRPWWLEVGEADGFGAAEQRVYDWSETYSTDEYVSLLQTHSDHILLSHEQRAALLTAVAAAIEQHGGAITLAYRTWLHLSRAEPRADESSP